MKTGADGGGCFPTGHHYPGIAHLLRVRAAGLAEEFAGDQPVAELPLVAVDTETTGRDPVQDRVIEVACVFWTDGGIAGQQSWLVNPGRDIPADALTVHGISEQDVRQCPSFEQVAPRVRSALEGHIPVAYNAEFDRDFLLAEFGRIGALTGKLPPALRKDVLWIDPLAWARELHKSSKSRALADVCQRLGIDIGQAHRAADDATATLRVLAALQQDARVPATYAAFMQEQQRLKRAFEEQKKLWRRG